MQKAKKDNKVDVINDDTIIVNDRIIFDKIGWDIVSKYERYVSVNSAGYAYISYDQEDIFIHRLLLGLPTRYDPMTQLIGEHSDTNRLNNRLSNLRVKKKPDNPKNCKKYKNSRNNYKGICYHKHIDKWETCVQHNKRQISYGVYKTEVDAAIAYNIVAFFLFKDMAHLNPLPFVADETLIPTMLERKANAGIRYRKDRSYWEVSKNYKKQKIRVGGFETKEQSIICLNKCKAYIDEHETIDRTTMNNIKWEVLSDAKVC